jgi:hypothetical protein
VRHIDPVHDGCICMQLLYRSGNVSSVSHTCIVLEEPVPGLHLHRVATHAATQHTAAHAVLHCAVLAATASCDIACTHVVSR